MECEFFHLLMILILQFTMIIITLMTKPNMEQWNHRIQINNENDKSVFV